ncbi:MAG: M23 family metallopeptidase [Chloroflexota bacterium]
MRSRRTFYTSLGALIVLLGAACTSARASTQVAEPSPGQTPSVPAVQDGAATQLAPSMTAAVETPTATLAPTQPLPTATMPPPQPTACPPELCTYAAQFFLARPIAAENNDAVDITYRFGSTQGGQREPHHGVEFLNPYGTPVLAAADGLVVVAGDDLQPTSERGVWPITYFGMFSNFYGRLVIIEHAVPEALLQTFPDLPQPIYSVYAHLSEITVQPGQMVKTGEQIGKVGMAGVAQGPHLHFEVRLGKETYSSYNSVSNPELWLMPHVGDSGQLNGGLAVRFLDIYGQDYMMSSLVLEHLPEGPDQPNDLEIHLVSYEEKGMLGRYPWKEGFAIGDLPPGLYRLNYPNNGVRRVLLEVLPGQLTVATFQLEK